MNARTEGNEEPMENEERCVGERVGDGDVGGREGVLEEEMH